MGDFRADDYTTQGLPPVEKHHRHAVGALSEAVRPRANLFGWLNLVPSRAHVIKSSRRLNNLSTCELTIAAKTGQRADSLNGCRPPNDLLAMKPDSVSRPGSLRLKAAQWDYRARVPERRPGGGPLGLFSPHGVLR